MNWASMRTRKPAARRNALSRVLWTWGCCLLAGCGAVLACCGTVLSGCGTVDDGSRTLVPIQRLPDPERFARQVHPRLSPACTAAACHGRADASLRLAASADPLPADSHPVHPLDLPEPYRADYYSVLAFCDLTFPEESQLLVWGAGADGAHTGQAALEPAAREEILVWLRSSAGGTP
jgi:hypothetical protein